MAKKKDNKKKEPQQDPKKKKKKVGRPKKRGRKKKYYKPVKKKKKKSPQSGKGFGSNTSYNRVRALLWRTHKEDFGSYREFISNSVDEQGKKIKGSSIVSQVYSECKSIECSDDDILAIYRQSTRQDKEGEPPVIPSFYYEPQGYWTLHTENIWDGLDERIWVYAPMLIPPPATFLGILGENRCMNKQGKIVDLDKCDLNKGDKFISGKKDLFLPFITYCNQFQKSGEYTATDELPHFRFVGKMYTDKDGKEVQEESPYWNEEAGRWEVQIVICRPSGTIFDYDFDPDIYDQEVPDEIPVEEIVEQEKEVIITEPSTIEKEIELEKQKEKTAKAEEKARLAGEKENTASAVKDITEMWKKGAISKDEMIDLIKIIKS